MSDVTRYEHEDFEILRYLGEGYFGAAELVRHSKIGLECVWKRLKNPNLEQKAFLEQKALQHHEFDILRRLNHPNVIRMIGTTQEPTRDYPCILSEFAGTDLKTLYQKTPIQPSCILKIFRDAFCALSYIHSKNIVHNDPHTGNIFINGMGKAILGDFGNSSLSSDAVHKAKDVFIMGLSVTNTVNRTLFIFFWDNIAEQVRQALDTCKTFAHTSEGALLSDIIIACLEKNPSLRPNPIQLVDHLDKRKILVRRGSLKLKGEKVICHIEFSGPRKHGARPGESYMHVCEHTKNFDRRNDMSTRVCVHDNLYGDLSIFVFTPDKENSYRIQLKGSRFGEVGRSEMSNLYVPECDGDNRDAGSTYVTVHDSKYSLWRLIPLGDGKFHIQLVGSRKSNGEPGPYLHAWDCGPTYNDYRDDGSTRICVHDKLWGDKSEWSIIPAS